MSRELRLRIDAVVPIEGRDAFKMAAKLGEVQALVQRFIEGLRGHDAAVGVSAPLVIPRSRSEKPRVEAPILTAIAESGGQLGGEHEPPTIDLTGLIGGGRQTASPSAGDDLLDIPPFLRGAPERLAAAAKGD